MTTRDTKPALCPECDGEGGWIEWHGDYDSITCDTCLGSGLIKVEHPDPFNLTHKEVSE